MSHGSGAFAWALSTVNEPHAWDDFVRWVWQRCTLGGADEIGLAMPPDVDAALLALCDHMADCPGYRCLTCALAEMARRCPDCDDPAFAASDEHVVIPIDVPTSRPLCEADNFPIVGVGCYGTVAPPVRSIARDR